MDEKVDLYASHYNLTEDELYRQVRHETYGEDLGQMSWITAGEARTFLAWLGASSSSKLLEIACGSGGAALLAAREMGSSVTGVDLNHHAVKAACEQAVRLGLSERAAFLALDASKSLPLDVNAYDGIWCNDSINHLPDRADVLREWHRLLKPGGKALYTDPIVVTGQLSNQEIAVRSSIGYFLFTPPGENERLIKEAGFELLRFEDVTRNTIEISKRWRQAREKRKELLVQVEGRERFEGLQMFLSTVHTLAREGRLSRFVYLFQRTMMGQ